MFTSLTQTLVHSFHFITLLTTLGGTVYTHSNTKVDTNEAVKVEDEWTMEVDLRSEEKEKRTLHWFVNGKQQKAFIKGVPDRVAFGV